jgi:hypothetical protein
MRQQFVQPAGSQNRGAFVRVAFVIAVAAALAGCNRTPPQPPQFAELMPVAMAPAPAPPPPAAAMPAEPPAPTGPAFGGHLASYTREADAERGWNTIVRAQGSIGSLKHYMVPVKTDRGNMIRLIAGDFTTHEEANRFCSWAKQQNLYCAVMQLDKERKMAAPSVAPTAAPGALPPPRMVPSGGRVRQPRANQVPNDPG